MLRPRSRPRPRRPIEAERWLRYLPAHPPRSTLSRASQELIAGVLAQRFQEPGRYRDDLEAGPVEWAPSFQPAPGHRWLPTSTPWRLWWPQRRLEDEWQEQQSEQEDNWLPTEPTTKIRLAIDHVRLELGWTGLRIFTDHIALLQGSIGADGSYDDHDAVFDELELARAAAGLTDWVVLDEQGLRMLERVCCDGCGRHYELSVRRVCCPRCGCGRVRVIGPTRLAAPPDDEAERLIALLTALGWLELSGTPAAVARELRPLLDDAPGAGCLSAVLLSSSNVAELHASDAMLSELLLRW